MSFAYDVAVPLVYQ